MVQGIHAEVEDHYPSKGRSNSPSTNGSLESRRKGKKRDEEKSKKRTLQTQKCSNTNIKLHTPKRVTIDEVEHLGSDTILNPNESRRARQREVHAGEDSAGADIDVNTCYICFGMYEDVRKGTEREWRECVCGRWVHEDCVLMMLL